MLWARYFLFFVTVFSHIFSIDMKYFVFPVTLGLVYQIGKMDTHNTIVRSYLNSPDDFGAANFIGYLNKKYLNEESGSFTNIYIGLPLSIFALGVCSTIAFSGKNFLNPLVGGSALTIAYAHYMPFKINPFIWKNKNGIKENKVIDFGSKKVSLNNDI